MSLRKISFRRTLATAFAFLVSSTGLATAQEPLTRGPFTFYGEINQGILRYNDGAETINYGRVDNAVNDNVNRFGFTYDNQLSSGWMLGGRVEIGFAPKPSDKVNQFDRSYSAWSFDQTSLRKFELSFSRDNTGTFYFGQGDMSARGPGPDYSGTTVVMTNNPADLAGGNFWRSTLTGNIVPRMISDSFGNFDTGRRFRLRYDTPRRAGFLFSGSIGREVLESSDNNTYIDLVGNYLKRWRTIDFETQLSFNGLGDNEYAARFGFALIHNPSGINVTFGTGHSTPGPHFGYVKAGVNRNYFGIGPTALSVDYYNSGKFVRIESESISSSIALVQSIDRINMDLFAVYRWYDAYNNVGVITEDFLRSDALMFGFRWAF